MEWRLELLLQGNSPKCPRGFFSFWEKSSCSILWLPPYKDGPVLSHSPLLQLGRGLSGSGSHTAQLSTLFSQRPQVSLGLPLSPLPLPPPSPSSLLICWCFLCWCVSSYRKYPGVPHFYILFFMVGLPWAMVVHTEPSLIRTLPGACGPRSLFDEVRTLPGQQILSLNFKDLLHWVKCGG